MSLLMDALKKAEREKNKAAKTSKESGDTTSEKQVQDDVSTEDLTPQDGTAENNTTVEEGNDENWAFDTGELELEPMPKMASAPDQGVIKPGEDATIAETVSDDAIAPQGTQQEDTQTIKSEFDHDATLPSERAIQSSLKDYFEASQSITMDKASISGPLTQNTSDHSFTNTSPMDSSATHVTAHTIFTANQTRQGSTGLFKYAIFGTLFLALGLGAVALYYSAMTPNLVETAPIAADIPGSAVQESSDTEVDVSQAPFEPEVALALNAEDPVLKGVVDAEADVAKATSNAEKNLEDQGAGSLTISDREDPSEVVASTAKQLEKQKLVTTADQPKKQKNNASSFSSITEPEARIIKAEQRNQQPGLAHTMAQGPLEVMSAKDFGKDLSVPKSAIKITRGSGKSRSASNSDLMNAYQAYKAGDLARAKAVYRRVLNSRPDNRDARLGIAAIAVLEGNRETASRHYQHLLQQNPKDEVVNAAIFNLQGNRSGAVNESQLKMLLDQSPDSQQLHFSLGSHYASQSRWPEAQQAFFGAFAVDKANPDYAYNLAVSLDQLGQTKAALGYYRKALKLADKNRVSFNTSRVLARIQKLSGLAVR